MKYKPGVYKVKTGYRHLVIAEHPEGDVHCFSIPKYVRKYQAFPQTLRVEEDDASSQLSVLPDGSEL